MEERGYIIISINGKLGDHAIGPKDVDIAEVKEMLNDVETFLYPNRAEKAERPLISYQLKEGSAKHFFHLPISGVLLFNGLTAEINSRGTVDFLDYKRAEIISGFQQKAKQQGLEIGFGSSLTDNYTLTINKETSFYNAAAKYINTEMVLYGKINSEGGNNPNFHILTKEYGSLVISATQKQLLEGEKRLYKVYGVRVAGKQHLLDGKPFDLKLIDYIDYEPLFDRSELDLLIKRASRNWAGVDDVDAWLSDLRSGTNG